MTEEVKKNRNEYMRNYRKNRYKKDPKYRAKILQHCRNYYDRRKAKQLAAKESIDAKQ